MKEFVGPVRDNIFFEEHFDAVGHRLKQSENAHPIRPGSILDSSQPFSFQPSGKREGSHERQHQRQSAQQNVNHQFQPREIIEKAFHPLAEFQKFIVEKIIHAHRWRSGRIEVRREK